MFALFLQSFVAVLFPECVTMLKVETRYCSLLMDEILQRVRVNWENWKRQPGHGRMRYT